MSRSLVLLCAIGVVASLASGCGGAPPKPSPVKAVITVSADVNPNPEGRASPVHLRVYQLKEDAAFLAADYWALSDKAPETLGGSLLQTLERDLPPGGQEELQLKIEPEARVLAVMAEFSDYRNATWRAVVKAPEKSLMDIVKKDRVVIAVEKNRVVLNVGD